MGLLGQARSALLVALLTLTLTALSPCAADGQGGEAEDAAAAEEEAPVLVGPVTRGEVEAAVPDWVGAQVEAEPDPEATAALAAVEPGARVDVYLGTWCSDSRRELSRLWRALDEAGGMTGTVPFELAYVAVDRDKEEPGELLSGVGLEYVPTFVVHRDGTEVGRVVEVAPHGIERDLLELLRGETSGVVTGREDTPPEP